MKTPKEPRRSLYWRIPREWEGETVAILGGGPSLTYAQCEAVRVFRRIAINDAGLILATDADVMCWGDARWYRWNARDLAKFKGKYAISWRPMGGNPYREYKLVQQFPKERGLAEDPSAVCANNSGSGAINIAYHFGVKRIILLGFDMRCVNGQNNWHKRHKTPPAESRYQEAFAPLINHAGKILASKGVEVINCTPNSALKAFPIVPLEKVLSEKHQQLATERMVLV